MNSIKKFTTQEEFEIYMNTPSKLLTLGILDDGRPVLKGSLCQISYKTTDNKAIEPGTTEGFGANYTGNEYLYSGNLSFDNKVTTIPEGAFSENDKLSEVTIPESVETIETGAFSNAENLQKVTIEGAPTIEEDAFNGISENGTIVVKNPEVLADNSILEQFYGWNGYTESGETSIIGGGEPKPEPEPEPSIDYSKVAMFFENVDEQSVIIGVTSYGSGHTATLETSTDGETWEYWGSTSTNLNKRVPIGGKLYVRATSNVGYFNNHSTFLNFFTSSGRVNVGGNIMSLGYKDFEDKTSITQNYAYLKVFYNMTNLVDASNLVLPAATLTEDCYSSMFQGCTSLTTAPALPAKTLATTRCYSSMFQGCTSLTTAPALPAETLERNCYSNMFKGCTGLTEAPELPAETLANYCYTNMFQGCTGLTEAPELPAETLAYNCYYYMFSGCTGLTTAPELPAETLLAFCYQGMFSGCTGLTTAPELPVETLAESCYSSMFYGCTSLTTAPELPATTLKNNCYQGMFYGCSNLNYIKALFTTTPSTSYTNNWVSGVASKGTFVKNPDATWDVTGVNGIPSDWTVVTKNVNDLIVSSVENVKYNETTANVNCTIVYDDNTQSQKVLTSSNFGTNTTYNSRQVNTTVSLNSITKDITLTQGAKCDDGININTIVKQFNSLTISAENVEGNNKDVNVNYTLSYTNIDNTTGTVTGAVKSSEFGVNPSSTESRNIQISITLCGLTANTTITQSPYTEPSLKIEYADDCVFYVPLNEQTVTEYFTNVQGVNVGTSSNHTWNSTENAYRVNGSGKFNMGLNWSGTAIQNQLSSINRSVSGYTVAVYAKFITQDGNGYSNYASASSAKYGKDGNATSCMAGYCPARYSGSYDNGWHWYIMTLTGTTALGYRDGEQTYSTSGWVHSYANSPIDVSVCDITSGNTSMSIYARDVRVYKRALTADEIRTFAAVN